MDLREIDLTLDKTFRADHHEHELWDDPRAYHEALGVKDQRSEFDALDNRYDMVWNIQTARSAAVGHDQDEIDDALLAHRMYFGCMPAWASPPAAVYPDVTCWVCGTRLHALNRHSEFHGRCDACMTQHQDARSQFGARPLESYHAVQPDPFADVVLGLSSYSEDIQAYWD